MENRLWSLPVKAKSSDDPEGAMNLLQVLNNPPLLPEGEHGLPRIKVNPSKDSAIKLFEAKAFDESEAAIALKRTKLNDVFIKHNRHISAGELGRPPVMPKKDHLYLLSVAGYSDGPVGDEASGDLHLQRWTHYPVYVSQL